MTISAILDTGAEWCIIDPELLELVDLEPVRQITYTTRFGDISGTLNRANIIVQAEYGEALALETTISVSYTHLDVYKRQNAGRASYHTW